MSALKGSVPPPAPPPPPAPGYGHTGLAMSYLRKAVGRLETLVVIGLVASVLTLFLDLAEAFGLLSTSAVAWVSAYGIDWGFAYGTAISVAVGLGLGLLVVVGLVNGIIGLVAWRRGVWNLRKASQELSDGSAASLLRCLHDDRRALLSAVGVVVVSILVGILLGIVDAALFLTGHPFLPTDAVALLEGLAAGAMVVLVYYYGSAHLLRALQAGAPFALSRSLVRGRDLILVGALLGWIGSVSSVYPPVQLLSVLGLVLALVGVHRFKGAFQMARSATSPVAWGGRVAAGA